MRDYMLLVVSSYVMQFFEHVNVARQEPIIMMEHVFTLLASLSHEITTSRKLAIDRRLQPESTKSKMLLNKEDMSLVKAHTERTKACRDTPNFELLASAGKVTTKEITKAKERAKVGIEIVSCS